MTLRPGVTFHNGVELTAQTIADMFPVQQAWHRFRWLAWSLHPVLSESKPPAIWK